MQRKLDLGKTLGNTSVLLDQYMNVKVQSLTKDNYLKFQNAFGTVHMSGIKILQVYTASVKVSVFMPRFILFFGQCFVVHMVYVQSYCTYTLYSIL